MNEKQDQRQSDKDLQNLDRAERLFADFKPGTQLSIIRLRPTWCGGFLEKLDCYDDEPLDIDYLINTWGGKLYKLRLSDGSGRYISGATLNLSSYPPRFQGRIIRPEEDWWKDDSGQSAKSAAQPIANPAPAPAMPSPLEMLAAFQKQRDADFKTLQSLLGGQTPQPRHDTLEELLRFGGQWKKLQEMFGGVGSAAIVKADSSDLGAEPDMLDQITKLITALRTNPPAPSQRHIVDAPQQNPAPKPSQQRPIAEVLAGLEPDKYSEILLTSLSHMSENNREIVIQNFLAKTGLLEDSDDDDDEDENDLEADDSDDNGTGLDV